MDDRSVTEACWRIGDRIFDASTGELRPADPDAGDAGPQRLAPQPARLLALLAEHGGELVPRETIREALWPDVHVEFDQGLHHCIRQLRAALDDGDGDAASLIENLPRRGYRLRVAPEPWPAPDSDATAPRDVRARRWGPGAIAAATLGLLAILASVLVAVNRTHDVAPTRVAIMPFAPPPGSAFAAEVRFVADHLLERLGTVSALHVIGPTSTERYAGEDALRRVIHEFEPAYVINARFIEDGEAPRVLAELIRVSDGAHVWVEPFPVGAEPRAVAEAVAAAVLGRLVDRPASQRTPAMQSPMLRSPDAHAPT